MSTQPFPFERQVLPDTLLSSYGAIASSPPAGEASRLERQICRIVRQVTFEMFILIGGQGQRRDRRHAMNHIRQIAIYVCHVGLCMPVPVVARCFGRDRSTIAATCLLVEERREQPGFDEFVSAIERLSGSFANMLKGQCDDTAH